MFRICLIIILTTHLHRGTQKEQYVKMHTGQGDCVNHQIILFKKIKKKSGKPDRTSKYRKNRLFQPRLLELVSFKKIILKPVEVPLLMEKRVTLGNVEVCFVWASVNPGVSRFQNNYSMKYIKYSCFMFKHF